MRNEVHVWTVALDRPAAENKALAVLSPDEVERAERFLNPLDRERFIQCRSALRRILAGVIEQFPSQLVFSYSQYGKPSLTSQPTIHFNVSHSHDIAVIAVGMGRAVGVDVERVRPDFATDEVARRFFSPLERETLRRLPAEARTEAFFRCWTRKEAFIKAIGEGLSFPLDRFDVTLAPNDAPRLLRIGKEAESANRWSMHDLPVQPGYLAALAVEGEIERVVAQFELPN